VDEPADASEIEGPEVAEAAEDHHDEPPTAYGEPAAAAPAAPGAEPGGEREGAGAERPFSLFSWIRREVPALRPAEGEPEPEPEAKGTRDR
jgi:hypothetical protein